MAPEIATARPGLFTTLRYDKADVWAAGALAYEIFGAENPFYSKNLTSRNYRSVEDLPPFPTDGVSQVVGHLVREMLDPNPRRRISAEMAANICQLLLWMPSPWLSGTRYPGTQDLLQWLLTMTTKVLYESRYSNSCGAEAEYHLIATFLSRFDLGNLRRLDKRPLLKTFFASMWVARKHSKDTPSHHKTHTNHRYTFIATVSSQKGKRSIYYSSYIMHQNSS